MIHELKTWPKYFRRVFEGDKTFEVRKADRDYQIGDVLKLKEWEDEKQEFTGRRIVARVRYILHGGQFGIEEGYCVMSIEIINN